MRQLSQLLRPDGSSLAASFCLNMIGQLNFCTSSFVCFSACPAAFSLGKSVRKAKAIKEAHVAKPQPCLSPLQKRKRVTFPPYRRRWSPSVEGADEGIAVSRRRQGQACKVRPDRQTFINCRQPRPFGGSPHAYFLGLAVLGSSFSAPFLFSRYVAEQENLDFHLFFSFLLAPVRHWSPTYKVLFFPTNLLSALFGGRDVSGLSTCHVLVRVAFSLFAVCFIFYVMLCVLRDIYFLLSLFSSLDSFLPPPIQHHFDLSYVSNSCAKSERRLAEQCSFLFSVFSSTWDGALFCCGCVWVVYLFYLFAVLERGAA